MNPYRVLEVNVEANAEQIKRAYRRLAQKYHPDKKDGDDVKFKEVQHAYEVLSDPARRKRYDETGDVGQGACSGEQSRQTIVMKELAQIFAQVGNHVDGKYDNPIEMAIEGIKEAKKKLSKMLERHRKSAENLRTMAKRTSAKGDNICAVIFDGIAGQQEHEVADGEQQLQLFDEMLEILHKHTYKTDKRPPGEEGRAQRVNFGGGFRGLEELLEAMRGG